MKEDTRTISNSPIEGAPTELLAQFLSTIMQKDYKNAATFCQLVQHFEPSNMIARVFYSKLLQKLELGSSDSEVEDEMSEENDEEDIEENESVSNDSNSSCDEQPTDEENANKVDEKCHPLKKNIK